MSRLYYNVKYLPKVMQLVGAEQKMPAPVIFPNCPTVSSLSNNPKLK